MDDDKIKKAVRESYGDIAKKESSCCGPSESCECGSSSETVSKKIGYTDEDIGSVPEGADLGLGCGNPVAVASLKEGETVIDLGSGAGFDCFLAAGRVGGSGHVIGVDMTPEMIEKARCNAVKGGHKNVEFRLGEIEHIPVADNSADIVISNCVINLVPDKKAVFTDALRVLKPGGRLMISDIVLLEELPDHLKDSVEAYVGCLAGATMKDDYINTIKEAGFKQIDVLSEDTFSVDLFVGDKDVKEEIKTLGIKDEEIDGIGKSIASLKISATKS